MPNAQIKDVPAHTHEVLRQRAALITAASMPTLEEVIDPAGGRAGGHVPIKRATEILRKDRDRR